MANILQGGKRGGNLPRLANGFVTTSQQYANRTDDERERGVMPPLLYAVEVHGKFGANRNESYTAQFSEDEMIGIVSEWTTMMNRRRIDAEQAKRRAEEQSDRARQIDI